MSDALFSGSSVQSHRIIYTPSAFARASLLYLQEVGDLHAVKSHTSSRSGLNSYLFFLVEHGSGRLTVNGMDYSIKTGDCVFLNCLWSYSHTPSPDDLWDLKWIHFCGPSMGEIYDKYCERGGLSVFHPDNIDSYSRLLSDVYRIAGNDDYLRDMRINEKIASLLTLIMSESWHPEASVNSAAKRRSLKNIKSYLDENYSSRISLDDIAEKFFINKFYLTRIFKEQFGVTVLSYLDHVRITHAKQLLRFSDMSIEEIGRSVGIDDPSYFNRVFRKIESITPGEYRRRW